MSIHKSSAIWNGNLPEGNGKMTIGEKAWTGKYSFKSRFEDGTGTSPEELIGAAHAGCFSMAFSHALDGAGYTPGSVETKAEVSLEKGEGGFSITKIHLISEGKVANISEEDFQKIANDAKENCPVSKALKAVEITLDASLV
ncbi:MAG: OsmC family protein [Bacteroidales bacterium]|nr:OsmC family protein [Bacteroidales bacterium]MCF8398463.1 OsmC family protein [Bacteroidales bacterium]